MTVDQHPRYAPARPDRCRTGGREGCIRSGSMPPAAGHGPRTAEATARFPRHSRSRVRNGGSCPRGDTPRGSRECLPYPREWRRGPASSDHTASFSEHVGSAVWPVKLVQIHIVGFHRPKRVFKSDADGCRRDRRASAHVLVAFAGDFGGDDHIVPPSRFFDPATDDPFRIALRLFRERVGGVHLGRIDEIDAVVECHVDLGMPFGRGVLRSPGHGSEAQCAHLKVGAAKQIIFQNVPIIRTPRIYGREKTNWLIW